MPQSERSQIIKQILKWLHARTLQKRPPTIAECIRHVESDICEMGAATRTIRKYLDRLAVHGLIDIKGTKVICTQTGKNWLEKKVS